MDAPESDLSTDEKILLGLNDDYIHSDQNSDVARYDEFLADDFTASLPDLVFRNRQEFLDLIAQPRPFTGLTLLNVKVRILGDVALLHGRVRYTTKHDGQEREALYTDTYQRRGHRWMCVAGEVVAQGELARDRRSGTGTRSSRPPQDPANRTFPSSSALGPAVPSGTARAAAAMAGDGN